MKQNKWILYLSLISFAATIVVYRLLPDQIPIHWNASGEIDNYGKRYFSLIMGALPIALYYMMIIIPKIDPRRDNYFKHTKAYAMIQMAIILFFIGIHWVTTAVALGYEMDVSRYIIIGVGLLFLIIGKYMPQLKHNYFVGIKTPWTLASEVVWKKTHQVGGSLFILFGILMVISAFIKGIFIVFVIITSVIVMVFGLFGYSYIIYCKNDKSIQGK
ncbi:MAG: SdpI family protein [Clostridiales bacterium]|nr:SdpI family protein [Clostridiales bacterium]